jgi:type IV pilus assembly protein PilY1
MVLAANVLLANKPLVDSTTSDVLPNLMFLLDNSGSMAQDYTPDWANSSSETLYNNSAYNTQFYNPNISYTPAVDYLGNSLGSQTTWTSVKNDAFYPYNSSLTSGTKNLVGNSSYYAFVAGEYCTAPDLRNCIASTAPTGTYTFAAPLRWCNSSANASLVLPAVPAASTCQAVYNASFSNLRTPSSTATITFTGSTSTSVTSIKVNGMEVLAASTTASTSANTVASSVATQINACTNASSGNCTLVGYSAKSASGVVTITSPYGNAVASLLPVVLPATGVMTITPTAFVLKRPGALVHVNITGAGTTYPLPGSSVKGGERSDCAGTVCTYAEEMTNYANWYTYYRTRMQGMKSAASLAFKPIDSRYRVGFYTINSPSTNYIPIAKYELGAGKQKQLWYNKLFSIVPNSTTPLRAALTTVGRIFAHKMSGYTADPVEYACQKNFTLMTTDGYWNDANSGVVKVDGSAMTDMDGAGTQPPLYEGPAATSTSTSSLADAAKYYYDTDIRTVALGNCTGALGQNVCGDGATEVTFKKQNMTTLTLGLGVDGTIQYSTDYKTQTTGDFAGIKAGTLNWPLPVSGNETTVDDLWHAAVNANGTYFSAKNPKQLTDSLKQALSDIQSKVGAGSAAAASTLQPTAGDNFNYIASYSTVKWTGNLEARTVNLSTFATSKDAAWCAENVAADACATPASLVSEIVSGSSVFYCKTTGSNATACGNLGGVLTGTDCKVEVATSCVGTMASKVGVTSDSRSIKFNSGGSLAEFTYGNLSATQKTHFEAAWLSTNLSQWANFTSGTGGQQASAVGNGIVNYLRGQQGLDSRASNTSVNQLFRYREATLGDITESQPAYIAKPVYSYIDSGYASFKTAQVSRAGTIYVGANDGMLHAFNASNGQELWAFVPTPVIPNMWALADQSYSTNHVNFVNGDPQIADICVSSCSTASAVWKTILVGGLSGGGRGYYALDITTPTSPSLLWEFTAQNNNANLGYTFATPVVTKLNDGTWVALITSGYNNGTKDNDGVTNNSPTGNGQGYLYVLNASTGALIKTFSTGAGSPNTPSGLAPIAAYADKAYQNNLTTYVYGGDLLGNLWRFDINSNTTPLLFATLAGPANVAQPITTIPQLGVINKQKVIFVGTGKYLEVADLSNMDVQTLYAIKDANLNAPLGNPRSSLVPQAISTAGTQRSVTTPATVNFSTGLGWRVDFPDPGERMNIDSFLVNGVLLAPTIVPSSTSCSPGGYGWFNYFNYATGGSVTSLGGLVSEKLNAPSVGFNLEYDANGQPVITVVESSNPTPHLIDKSGAASGGTGNRTTIFPLNSDGTYGVKSIWRELTK